MLFQSFQTYWKEQYPNFSIKNIKLLLAVSGGVDSIVLTHLTAQADFHFAIAHCNFQLRGSESERDETFVRLLGEKYNKEVFVKKFDTKAFATQQKISIQEAARDLRYEWFKNIIDSWQMPDEIAELPNHQVNLIATAHHANDNIETILINFFRGAGISSLHGILPKRGNIIRPLLFAKREDIIDYANENNLNWVEDSSNASEKYTRNLFRLQIIPAIKEVFPKVETNLLHNIERFKEIEILYNQAIEEHKKNLVEHKGNEFHIPILKLQKVIPLDSVIWEIIKKFGFTVAQTDEVKKLFKAENGSYISSASYRIIKNRNWLIIAPVKSEEGQHILIEEQQKKVFFQNGIIALEIQSTTNHQLLTDKLVAALDAKNIIFPLLLRKWEQGDYFYPLGMRKKKKLSKFFIDIKLSKPDKEKVWVIEMNKKIIWVIGYRIDDRFKINDNTKNVLKITCKPATKEH